MRVPLAEVVVRPAIDWVVEIVSTQVEGDFLQPMKMNQARDKISGSASCRIPIARVMIAAYRPVATRLRGRIAGSAARTHGRTARCGRPTPAWRSDDSQRNR